MFMDGFVFDLVIFSIIYDCGGVVVVLDGFGELRVNLSWPKIRVLAIMQGLVSFNIKHVIWVYLIEKWIFDVYDYEVKLNCGFVWSWDGPKLCYMILRSDFRLGFM